MDQRIERSQAALRQAVFQLLLAHPYEAITVDDIARRAGVARSTFYVHFEDKDELLRASLAAPFGLLSQLVAEPVPEKMIVASLEHMRSVRDMSLAMLRGNARAVVAQTLATHVEMRLGQRGLHRPGRLLMPYSMLSRMLADAMLAVIDEWLQAERPMPVVDLAHVLVRQARAIVDASRAV